MSFIDPEVENVGYEMMVRLRKDLDKKLLDLGFTQEAIQSLVEKSIDGIRINGVPVRAIDCPQCKGKGWVVPPSYELDVCPTCGLKAVRQDRLQFECRNAHFWSFK